MKQSLILSMLVLMLGVFALATPAKADMNPGPELDGTQDYYAVVKTSAGPIFLQLYADKSPLAVRNFVNLAEGTREYKDPKTNQISSEPYYDGVKFHRIIKGFMIQGGDPTASGRGGPGYQFNNERHASLSFNKDYILAMANAGPNTNGAQFFITTKNSRPAHLDGGYTIFGHVLEKGDTRKTVDALEQTPNSGGNGAVARKNMPTMETIEIIRVDKGTETSQVIFEIAKSMGLGTPEASVEEPAIPATPAIKPAAQIKPAPVLTPVTPTTKPAARTTSRPVRATSRPVRSTSRPN